MDPREMEALVQRLVQNPHDQDAITQAHQAGQSDPKSYAMLLEKVGTATSDPALACHWLTEAANVWSVTLADAHRAARALMIAIDRDPTQSAPAERLADLYREKGDAKALVALLERRAKALTPLAAQDQAMRAQLSALHEELGRLWSEAPLEQPKKALENFRRAVDYDPSAQFAIYSVRELHKGAEEWADAIPYFAMEIALVSDQDRQIALYQDEGEVRRSAGDLRGAAQAFRRARALEGGQDATLRQLLGTALLEQVQGGDTVSAAERSEGAGLFISLAEEYPGEHGLSYSVCALELEPASDRAVQLAMYYGAELGRSEEVAPQAAAYVQANQDGAMVSEARALAERFGATPPPPPEPRQAAPQPAQPAQPARQPTPGAAAAALQQVAEPVAARPLTPSETELEQVRALVEQAQALARKARKNEAAAKYREVLALEAANADAMAFLEPYFKQLRKFGDLREMLLAAARSGNAELSQRVGWLRDVAGMSEAQLRDAEGAVGALKEILDLEPSDDAARSSLKRLLERGNRWDDLGQVLEQEAELETDIEARIAMEKNIAKMHEGKRKDPVAAGQAWARIALLAPEDDSAIDTALTLLERGGRPDAAAQMLGDVLPSVKDEAQRATLLRRLGEFKRASNELLPAGEAFAEAASLTKSAELWHAAEQAFAGAEAWDQAATAASERGELEPNKAKKAVLVALEGGYLLRSGDEGGALARLEQATELDAENDELARDLEQRYEAAERFDDEVAFLLKRAERLDAADKRAAQRRRAAELQREKLGDADAARETLVSLLQDGDDIEALTWLADDAETRGDAAAAAEFLGRLSRASTDPAARIGVMLREAALLAGQLDDPKEAIARYESILEKLDPSHDTSLLKIAELQEKLGDSRGVADALERRLKIAFDDETKLEVANKLADLYDGPLESPKDAVRVLDIVRGLDAEDFGAIQRLCELCEKLELWPRVAEHLAQMIEVEGDAEEISSMTRRLAEILHTKVERSDEALAVLMAIADGGDEPCRDEYVALGDKLGWKGVVATKLVEWYIGAAPGPQRNEALRGAFDRFIEVGRTADAANVGRELARSRGADAELGSRIERIAVELKDLDALGVAHDLLVAELSGPARAEEMVRQAEVLVQAGVEPLEAIQHGEQALTSVPPGEVESLLARLAKLAPEPAAVVDLYERQVTRCKNPQDKTNALARAARMAAAHDSIERTRSFLDLLLSGSFQEDTIALLEDSARTFDQERGGDRLRRTLAEALSGGGQGSRDGGRTRGSMLGRAGMIAFHDLKDTELAFKWLGDAIVAHVDDERLDALEALAEEVGDPNRADTVVSRALEEVFDGPLVRKLLARRAQIRKEKLSDVTGAASDLKRLHDLSPADQAVVDQLLELYTELEDYRGMVQLYEDQILRGKDPNVRAELARKVARLWEEQLGDPRETADAWRRVLRMKPGDPEGTEGLERAKTNMLKRPKSEPDLAAALNEEANSKAEPKAETKAKGKAAKAAKAEAAPPTEPEAAAEPEPKPEEPKPEAELAAPTTEEPTEAKAEAVEPEAKAEAVSEPETKAEAASDLETKAEAASDLETKAEAASDLETKAEAAIEPALAELDATDARTTRADADDDSIDAAFERISEKPADDFALAAAALKPMFDPSLDDEKTIAGMELPESTPPEPLARAAAFEPGLTPDVPTVAPKAPEPVAAAPPEPPPTKSKLAPPPKPGRKAAPPPPPSKSSTAPPPPSSRVPPPGRVPPPPPGRVPPPPPKGAPLRASDNGNSHSDVTEIRAPLGMPEGDEIDIELDEK